MSKKTNEDQAEKEKVEYENFWQDPKIKGRIKTGIFLVIFLIFFIVNNTGNSIEEGPYPPYNRGKNKIDFIAPNFVSNSLSGNKIELSEMKGKAVILDFFSYRSHQVSTTIPILSSLKNEYGDKLEIIGISLDRNTNEQNIKTYLEKFSINYPIVIADYDLVQRYGLIYEVNLPNGQKRKELVNPATIIIDQNGHIFAKYGGQLKKDTYLRDLDLLIK